VTDPTDRPPDDPPEPPALAALVELRRAAVKPHAPGDLQRGLATLRARIARERSHWPALIRGALFGAAVLAVVLGSMQLIAHFRGAPRAGGERLPVAVQRIEGGALVEGGYLAEAGRAGIQVYFNEGTRFVLQPRTRGRLREISREGATLSIEEGAAAVEVTQDPTRRWAIEAGPFLVTVKGTVFDVSWDPTDERFELKLRRGHVVVSGPVVGGSIPLRAGQHLAIRLPLAETVITETAIEEAARAEDRNEDSRDDHATAARGTAGRTTSPPAPVAPGRALPGKRAVALRSQTDSSGEPIVADPRRAGAQSWPALLATGQWDRILAAAERRGVEATLEQAPSEDLFALADAARYSHRVDLASAALLAQRRRFPDSPRSLDAVFLLGRVAELREGETARATAFYDQYLERAPAGPYAALAMGRKMILARDDGDMAKARRIAREYLVRFPTASYAAAARALARGP